MSRLLALCLVCVVGVLGPQGAALAEEPSSSGGSSSLFESPLTVGGGESLLGGEQQQLAEEARRANPEAAAARAASASAYETLGPSEAQEVDDHAFARLIDEPAGGPPKLPEGERISKIVAANTAQVSLPDGRHGVLESLAPIATRSSSSGEWAPIDLGLEESGGAFQPKTPVAGVRVRIPKRLGEGAQLTDSGVSLTPLDEHGAALEGAPGVIDGASVYYGDSEGAQAGAVDMDSLVKATTGGFSLETILRSQRSAQKLFFKVGLPEGASLVQAADGSVQVVEAGQTIATIPVPRARDAEGASVPVSVGVSGDVLALTVDHAPGQYRLPIAVDPTVSDSQFKNELYYGTYYHTNWHFLHEGSAFTAPEHPEGASWTENISGSHTGSESGGLFYTTRGESVIYYAHVEGRWNDSGSHIQNYMVLYAPGPPPYTESYNSNLPVDSEERWPGMDVGASVCSPELKCSETTTVGAAQNNNTAGYQQESTGSGGGVGGWNTLKSGYVEISQERSPELSFNKSSQYLCNGSECTPNVLYGGGGWLGPHSGAFEVHARDFGIGISHYRVLSSGWGNEHWYYALGECVGVQCPPEINQKYPYDGKMSDGEVSFEAFVEDEVGLYAQIYPQKIKVDATPPHNIEVSGFANGDELGAGETLLKVKASDGSGSTPSSGVKSIAVSVDGQQIAQATGQAPASCPEGPCTASGEWPLAGRNYATGQHALIVTATDNAGNVAKEEFKFVVHQASPVSAGPGSVNPESGQYTLGATDVSMGEGLQVGRSYDSRHLTAGAGGPFGPQWSVSVGGMQSLQELPNKSVVLSSGGGGGTMFVRNEKGEFEPPKGDGNLALKAEESKGEVSEYVLKDASAGTTTSFTLPEGSHLVPPYSGAFGSGGTGLGQFKTPVSMATDPSGDVWTTDIYNDRIEEFGPEGKFVRSVGSAGSGSGQFYYPWGMAINQSTGNLYVSDQGNARVDEFTRQGGFIRSFGSSGSGAGQFSTMAGIAVDSTGNVWVCDHGDNRIEEFSAEGVYESMTGSEGSGSGQFKGPLNIAFSGGNLYVTDGGNNRVQELSPAGGYVRQFGTSGSGNGQFSNPYGIASDPVTGDLYVADYANNRVQEFSPSGTYLAKFGAAGSAEGDFSSPSGVATDGFGDLYVADAGNNRVQDWEIQWGSGPWMPTVSKGPVATDTQTYTYRTAEVEGKQVTEPLMELAPKPTGVECGSTVETLKRGCRALTFTYATKTTAEGENESEWSEYNGRLMKVSFTAYDPSSKKMTTTVIAQYVYDKRGRLRAEWDPGVSPALKTTYGYDEEGHVTGLSSPGQEPWVFTYGTIQGDPGTGRLLKFMRPTAATGLWGGTLPKDTEAPKVIGTPVQGLKMAVSNGKWSGSPVTYDYQWEDCSGEVTECTPIPGATNANYIVASNDVGHTLVAQVTAMNGGGAVLAASSASASVHTPNINEYAQPSGSKPSQITSGPDGNLWFTDESTSKLGRLTTAGAVTEYSLPSGSVPKGITSGSDGKLWFVDEGTDKIGKATTAGAVTEYSLPAGSKPARITLGSDGNLWFTDAGTSKVGKITTAGAITEYSLPVGAEPNGITSGADSALWFTERKLAKIGRITTAGAITGYSLPSGSEPSGIASGSDGALWFTERKIAKIGRITTAGAITEYPVSSGSEPYGIASGSDGALWFVERQASKIGRITTAGATSEYSVPSGSEPFGIASGPDGNLWYTDFGTSKVGEITISPGEQNASEPGATIEYNVALAGTGLPSMTKAALEKWGQKDEPVEAMAIFPPDEPQGWPASDYKRATIHYIDANGRAVNTAAPGGGVATSEYNEMNDVTRALSAGNRAVALEAGAKSVEVAEKLDTRSKYSEDGTELLETKGPEHEVKIGKEEKLARNHVRYYYDEGAPESERYGLVTKVTDGALLSGGEEVEVRTTTTSYSGQEGLGWKLRKPTSVTKDPGGLKLTSTTIYDKTTGAVTETRSPAGSAGGSPRDTRIAYYTPEGEAEVSGCRNHREWAGLTCQTEPAAQPEGSLPRLPVTAVSYNMWDEPEVTVEAFGTTTRTKTVTYDAAGRVLTSEETSTADTPLPKVTDEYSSTTGALVKQSAKIEGEEKSVTSAFDRLGRLTSYTDASANTTKYEYEAEGDGRLTHVDDGKGTQTYTYDSTTGAVTKLVDSAAGTFTAGYDVAGRMTSETYPNGMTATYIHNPAGEVTSLGYVKTSNCSEKCTWFSNTMAPGIHGETISEESTLASQSYAYDGLGRATQVQETPSGKGCTTRLYAYDEESDRTSLTTREPGGEGKCATEGGTSEAHTYDQAGRLTDTGVGYDAFANTTTLPASDAGGHALTSSFYVDGQVQSQTQNEHTIGYTYDPVSRVLQTSATSATSIDHYSGPGEALTWKDEGSGKWTRNIAGIDGSLTATQTNGETPVLRLHDLHGNVVATASESETATKLLSTYQSTEFGVPSTTSPPKFSWLGASGVSSELPTTGIVTNGAGSYVPEIGRALQTEAVIPIVFADGTVPASVVEAPYLGADSNIMKGIAIQEEAAREAAQAAQAAEKAEGACAIASMCVTPEEEGDPCTTSFAQNHASLLGSQFISAWATISWCYGGGHVLSASLKNRGDHVHNHWWWPERFKFIRWESSAYWLAGGVYFVEEVAVFTSKAPDIPVPDVWEGGTNPTTTWYITMRFELFPNGTSKAWGITSCEPLC